MSRRRKFLLALLLLVAGLGAALAWHIHTWGRPLPAAYRPVEITPANPGGDRSFTYLAMNEEGEPTHRLVEVDTDGDGTIDVVMKEGRTLSSFNRPRTDDRETRWLVLCLDGVPYEELRALWEEGYFREFFRPVPVISPFPSASGVALTSLFHTAPVAGYEDAYFDRARNRLSGGPLKTATLEDIPYLKAFDYDLPGYLRGPAYLLPVKSYRAELGRLRNRFLTSPNRVFIAHLATTDSLYHVVAEEKVRHLLIELDALLRELYLHAQGRLRITLFSDHGNSLAPSRPVPLKKALAEHGWRLDDRLEQPRDVVVPAYGLVGFLAVYCRPAARADLAADLAEMEGADLVVYAKENSVVIQSRRGRARLEWTGEADAFRYQPLTGDPLQLTPILAGLEAEGKVGSDGWVKDADFFQATADHHYPDSAYRLWQWTVNHVRHRADLLVSLQPGYYYGSRIFEWIVDLRSAHGALDRAQSTGFAMSTDEPWAGALRTRQLLPKNLPKPDPQRLSGQPAISKQGKREASGK